MEAENTTTNYNKWLGDEVETCDNCNLKRIRYQLIKIRLNYKSNTGELEHSQVLYYCADNPICFEKAIQAHDL